MFFWNFQSEFTTTEREKTVLWLNGGPGCSSMDGAVMEVGPFRAKDKNTLEPNPGAWSRNANMLFVDQPIGVGFSTADTDSYIHELSEMAADMITFLKEYIKVFPEVQNHEFYIAGESYAGQYIPYIAKAIIDENNNQKETWMDLKGVMIGNGWIDPVQQYLSYVPFAYETGMLNQGSSIAARVEQAKRGCMEELQNYDVPPINTDACDQILNVMLREMFIEKGVKKEDPKACMNIYDIRLTDSYASCGMNWPDNMDAVNEYLRREDVMTALNIDKSYQTVWKECSGAISSAFKAKKSAPSVTLIPGLIENGVKVLMYNGDKDMICNHLGNSKLIENLAWGGETLADVHGQPDKHAGGFKVENGETEESWYAAGHEGGTIQEGRNLTYIRVFNASHMVPVDVPELSQVLLNQFIGIPGFDLENQKNANPKIPDPTDGIPSSTDSDTSNKDIDEATWKAYYRAGGVSLVVVILLTGLLIFFVLRNRSLMRRSILLNARRPRGVHYEDGTRSGDSMDSFDDDADRPSNIVDTLISGFSRWHRPHQHRRQPSNKYVLTDDDEDDEEAGVPLNDMGQRHKRSIDGADDELDATERRYTDNEDDVPELVIRKPNDDVV